MISIIIPTRNRAKVLERTLSTYIDQDSVTELVIVDDNGSDDLIGHVNSWKKKYPSMVFVYNYNSIRKGAAASRNIGVNLASNEVVLFGEDDLYLAENYCRELLPKLLGKQLVGVVSGQIIYLRKAQSTVQASDEYFNSKVVNKDFFKEEKLEITSGIRKQAMVEVVFTHAIFMTTRTNLLNYPFDESFDIGNGYREESTAQIKMFNAGLKNLVFFDMVCFHMHKSEVQSGGQRLNRLISYGYCIRNTSIFYVKYVNRSLTAACFFLLKYSLLKFIDMFILPVWKKVNAR